MYKNKFTEYFYMKKEIYFSYFHINETNVKKKNKK